MTINKIDLVLYNNISKVAKVVKSSIGKIGGQTGALPTILIDTNTVWSTSQDYTGYIVRITNNAIVTNNCDWEPSILKADSLIIDFGSTITIPNGYSGGFTTTGYSPSGTNGGGGYYGGGGGGWAGGGGGSPQDNQGRRC